MAILRFRVFWEEDDQTYRDIEIMSSQSFLDLHKAIYQAYEFDGKHSASFYESSDRWNYGRELNSEVTTNSKNAPALSMSRTPVSALISEPDQKFIYVYDPAKKWTFQVELIHVSKDEVSKRVYPYLLRKEGIAPAQYGIKGVNPDKIVEIEERYDLGTADMDGFGDEGDEATESTEESAEEGDESSEQMAGLDD